MPRGTARAPAEQRRAEILGSAQTCFTERGYHETTIDHIAERCGLSKGAIYWHFQGKRELFLALFDWYREMAAAGRASVRDTESAADGLHRWAHTALLDLPDVAPLVELVLEYMAHAGRDEELRQRFALMYADLESIVTEQVERGIADGSFRPVDPRAVARALFALGDGLLMQLIVFPDLDLSRAVHESLDLVLRGIQK